jgi:hypothetical protein
MYYTVLRIPNDDHGSAYEIFTGKTQLAATHRAQESLIDSTPGSREEWEEEHGPVKDDAHWLEIMEDNGFIIAAAELEEDDE